MRNKREKLVKQIRLLQLELAVIDGENRCEKCKEPFSTAPLDYCKGGINK